MSRTGRRTATTRDVRRLLAAGACSLAAVACTSASEPVPTASEYRSAVQAVCTTTSADREQLTEPTDAAAVADFATAVADLLNDEAEAIRSIRPPADLDGDHRAFVQNTADQAARWSTLATTPSGDTEVFGALTDEIAALSFGRDDLAADMLIDACKRAS